MPKTRHLDEWRNRLGEALERHWKKRAAIAEDAETTQETISRILTGRSRRPGLDVVVRIAHAAGVTVGWLLGEPEYRLPRYQKRRLRDAAEVIDDILNVD